MRLSLLLLSLAWFAPAVATAACEDGADRDGDGTCDADDDCPDVYDPTQGPFGSESVLYSSPYSAIGALAVADLDGDVDLDVALAGFDAVRWWPNLGGGTFGQEQVVVSTDSLSGPELIAEDLDADGDTDLLSATEIGLAWQANRGDGTFEAHQLHVSGDYLYYTTLDAVDLDGDGDHDVVASYVSTVDAVVWFENLGGGTFGGERVLSTAQDEPASVAPADFDGDGDLDLAVGSFGDKTLATYENLGGGLFGPALPVQVGNEEAPEAFDVDGDGDPDLLDGQAGWHENFGNDFGPLVAIDPTEPGASFLPADLDGDGDLDVLEPHSSCYWYLCIDDLYWRPNLGGGSFGKATYLVGIGRMSTDLAVADLDGDGDQDIVYAGDDGYFEDGVVLWLTNGMPVPLDTDGDGTCDESDRCAGQDDTLDSDLDGTPNGCDVCAPWVDADLDGIPDACDRCPGYPDSGDADSDGVADGCDACPLDAPNDTDGDGACDSEDQCLGLDAAGDADEDGTCADLDPCTGEDATGDADLDGVCDDLDQCPLGADSLDRDGDGVFDACDACPTAATDDSDGDTVCDDVDRCGGGDDRLDADADAVPDGCDDCALAFDPSQGALFLPHVMLDADSITLDVEAGDVDADGDADLLAAGYDGLRWFVNDGQGGFSAVLLDENRAQAVLSTDVDGDGDLDVVAAEFGTSAISWFENQGTSFGGGQPVQEAGSDFTDDRLVAGDLDGDGDADLLVASDNHNDDPGKGVAWFESFGDGTYGPSRPISPPEAGGATSAFVADLDGDDDPDVLAAHVAQQVLVWYPNLGSGSFGAGEVVEVVSTATNAASAIAADLDGDGDADIAAGIGAIQLVWYLNDGAGGFGEESVLAPDIGSIRRVAAADLDGDGDLDLVTGSTNDQGNSVLWWENGGGTFNVGVPVGPTGNYLGLAVADLDGDSDPDLAVGSGPYPDSQMGWFPNQLPLLPDCDGDGLCDAMEADLDEDGVPDECGSEIPRPDTGGGPPPSKPPSCGCATSGGIIALAPLWIVAGVTWGRRSRAATAGGKPRTIWIT
ncbi:MAG: FG-GAP-like repeat-containing protein [Myxococcota bacterium]